MVRTFCPRARRVVAPVLVVAALAAATPLITTPPPWLAWCPPWLSAVLALFEQGRSNELPGPGLMLVSCSPR